MLVLTRGKNDTIVINERITITVVRIKGGQIGIGIAAPPEDKIRRGEIPPEGDQQGGDAVNE